MSDDIKARLRHYADQIRREYKSGDPAHDEDCVAMVEAADRIEALEAENARLRGALTQIGLHGAPELSEIARAALSQDNPQSNQGAGDQADDAE